MLTTYESSAVFCEECCRAFRGRAAYENHLRSGIHHRIREIREYFSENPRGTLREIGERLGVSRERIRQIMEYAGMETRTISRAFLGAERMKHLLQEKWNTGAVKEFISQANNRGIRATASGWKQVSVTGKIVVVCKSGTRKIGNRLYERIFHPWRECDVAACLLSNGEFFIAPITELNFSTSTFFSLNEPLGNRKGAYIKNHGYRKFIGNWEVFS